MATAFRPDKPQPTFADRILQADPLTDRYSAKMSGGKDIWGSFKSRVRASQKFVLDVDAMQRIVDAMDAAPEQLVYNAKFALPPHETTWLEMMSPKGDPEHFNTAYLIHQGAFYAVTITHDAFLVMPWVIDLNVPPTRAELQTALDVFHFTQEELNKCYWGRLYDAVPEHLRGRMTKQHRLRFYGNVPEEIKNIHTDFDIHVRMVIGTFLALNQPKSALNITAKEAQRRVTAKGMKNYMAHNVVTIQLGKKTDIRFNYRVPGGTHAGPRWHEVMGHWVHFPTEQGKHCTHGYGQDPDWWESFTKKEDDGRIRYQCRVCKSKRVWREYPEGRGDGSKGMSLHHHVVQG